MIDLNKNRFTPLLGDNKFFSDYGSDELGLQDKLDIIAKKRMHPDEKEKFTSFADFSTIVERVRKTSTDKEVQTETLSLKARPLANGMVKAKTGDSTTDAVYNAWYDAVYQPSSSGDDGEDQAEDSDDEPDTNGVSG